MKINDGNWSQPGTCNVAWAFIWHGYMAGDKWASPGHQGWPTVQVRAGTLWLPADQGRSHPQPTCQERESSHGTLELLFWGRERRILRDSDDTASWEKLVSPGRKLKPQSTCFIFCLYNMHVFNVCFYFSLQAFFPLHKLGLFQVSTACPLMDVWCQRLNVLGSLEHFYFLWLTP